MGTGKEFVEDLVEDSVVMETMCSYEIPGLFSSRVAFGWP